MKSWISVQHNESRNSFTHIVGVFLFSDFYHAAEGVSYGD